MVPFIRQFLFCAATFHVPPDSPIFPILVLLEADEFKKIGEKKGPQKSGPSFREYYFPAVMFKLTPTMPNSFMEQLVNPPVVETTLVLPDLDSGNASTLLPFVPTTKTRSPALLTDMSFNMLLSLIAPNFPLMGILAAPYFCT